MTDETGETRRRFLVLATAGAAGGLAGCAGGGGEETESPTEAESPTEIESPTEAGSPTGTEGGGGTGTPESVPAEYETATSLGGTQRDPDALSSKEAVQYQSTPNEGQRCSDCQFFITDMNGDGLGACAIVEGTIDPEGWCASYAEFQGGTRQG